MPNDHDNFVLDGIGVGSAAAGLGVGLGPVHPLLLELPPGERDRVGVLARVAVEVAVVVRLPAHLAQVQAQRAVLRFLNGVDWLIRDPKQVVGRTPYDIIFKRGKLEVRCEPSPWAP